MIVGIALALARPLLTTDTLSILRWPHPRCGRAALVVVVFTRGMSRHRSIWSSLSLAALGSGSGAVGELGEPPQGCVLFGVAEESLLLDDLGSMFGGAANVLHRDGGVPLGVLLDLGNSVSGLVLQSHGESSSEILVSFVLPHRDSDGIGGLGGAVPSITGEDVVCPGLAHELGLVAVPALGQAPDNLR